MYHVSAQGVDERIVVVGGGSGGGGVAAAAAQCPVCRQCPVS